MRRTLFAAFLLCLVGMATPATAERLFALTPGNRLIVFDSASPSSIAATIPITGLAPGESLVGIDFRPATPGQLVGVGNQAGAGRVYAISPLGLATAINSGFALSGNAFGVDFNPVPNALRIVSNAGQNLRITAGGTGVANSDGTLKPGSPNVVGGAYSNNVAGGEAGRTTLYVIDSATDALLTQGTVNFPPGTSPNTGTLFPVGALGVNVPNLLGFDISGITGDAFAAFTPAGAAGSSLFTIDLVTGAASLVGPIGDGTLLVSGLSVNPVAAPGPLMLVGLGIIALAGCGVGRQREQA